MAVADRELSLPELSAKVTPGRSWRRRLLTWFARAAAILFCLGLIVRLTVADRWLGSNTIYYATPWSILALLACIGAIRSLSKQSTVGVVLWTCAAVGCAAMWHSTSWRPRSGLTSETGVKVVTWNMAHGLHGFEAMIQDLAALNPDIAVAIEADPKETDTRPIFKKAFPNHHIAIMGGGLVLVSRWPAGETRPYRVGDSFEESRVREIDVETPSGTWTVFGVDMASSPYYSRRRAYEELATHIATKNDRPVIVAGDFNTPVDSVHYEHFHRLGLKELFLTAGQGYLPTWPVPTPVLSLDQIWVNDKLKPIECHREWSWHSDHAGAVGMVAAP